MEKRDGITIAEDGEEIITVHGGAVRLGLPYSTINQWIAEGKLDPPYESEGFRYKRYSWKKMQEVAAWKPAQTPQTQAS